MFWCLFLQIIENDCAYEVDGDVYFSVDKFPSYGRLSGRKIEDNRAGERVAVDTRKRNPADFALWKVIFSIYDVLKCCHSYPVLILYLLCRLPNQMSQVGTAPGDVEDLGGI